VLTDVLCTGQELIAEDLFGQIASANSSRMKRMKLSVKISAAMPLKHAIAIAIACGIVLLILPGCHIIPTLREPAPPPILPEEFKGGENTPENSSEIEIEEFYTDPLLISLIHQSLANNRELKILNEEVQLTRNEILSRSGAYLPFVSAGFNSGLTKYSLYTEVGASLKDDTFLPGQLLPNPIPNTGFGLNLLWRLDVYRQLRNARDAAAQRYVAANERRNFFVTKMVAEVADNYYGLMALDKRLENLTQIIEILEQNLKISIARKEAARGTELPILRFQAEVRRNQSEKLIVNQDIIETENRINFLVNRYPERVERMSAGFYDQKIHDLSLGLPSQLLRNRPDVRQAERELVAAGLDVKVARVNFFPQFVINGGVGYEAFNPKYLLITPEALLYNIAGGVVAPFVNFRAIQADYLSANARQLQAVYNYQRVILEAFTQVINRLNMVKNYTNAIEIKKQQLERLEASVEVATKLFQNARTEYTDVLLTQRDLRDARVVLIDTKRQQLTAIVSAYQAIGGGLSPGFKVETAVIIPPLPHWSGPPSPAGPPPPGTPSPPGMPLLPPGPPLPPGSLLPPGPPLEARPLPPVGPSAPAGPANPPVQEKPPTELLPLPASASATK
jgi:multidrug efflux system outer membrane protein